MAVLTTDSAELYYKDWGKGDPVILIHGWPLTADTWDYIAMQLVNAGFRVISYDRRGFGRSSQSYEGYHYDQLADDLSAFIEQLSLDRVNLVGFSMGGGEVARYLSRHGSQKINKVVLISSVVPFLLKTPDHLDGVDQSVFNGMVNGLVEDRPKFLTEFFKDFYGISLLHRTVSDDFLAWNNQMALQASLKASIDCVRAFSETDFRADLAAFDRPTLIIHGSADRTVPIEITARAVKSQVAQAELIEYEDEAHGILATQQDRVSQDLIRFLKQPS